VNRSRLARGLLLGCHPLPCLAVTAFATAYALALGRSDVGFVDVSGAIAVALAILSGQLVVGWTNDAFDAGRDLATARPDKPVSLGLVTARQLWTAAAIGALVCVVLSFRLGAVAGWLHLLAVAVAVSYNVALKSTALSPLPYLVSFGLLPVIVGQAVLCAWVPWPHALAAALLGAGAHFGNTVGDAEVDAATGVRGLPQRLGPQRSLVAMAVLVAAAAVVMLSAVLADRPLPGDADPAAGHRRLAVALLVAGVALAATGARRQVGVPARVPAGGGRVAWRLTLAAVALVIAGFLIGV
jgi:heme o synthase